MPEPNRQDGSGHKRPRMQFSLSVLAGIVVVSALVFGGIKIVQERAMAEDAAFGIMGWFLLAALAFIVAGTQWKAAQAYKLYLDEHRRSVEVNRRSVEEYIRSVEASKARVEQLIRLQGETNGLLQEMLNELRKRS